MLSIAWPTTTAAMTHHDGVPGEHASTCSVPGKRELKMEKMKARDSNNNEMLETGSKSVNALAQESVPMTNIPLDLSSRKKMGNEEVPNEAACPLDLSKPKQKTTAEPNIQGSNFAKCSELYRSSIATSIATFPGTPETAIHPDLKSSFRSIWDWKFVPIANPDPASRIFVLGIGGTQVFWFSPLLPGSPLNPLTDVPGLELPGITILYAELVMELQGEGSQQTHHQTIHIIDALMLENVDISQQSLRERYTKCNLFVAALGNSQSVRMKPLFELHNLPSFFSGTKEFLLREGKRRPGCIVSNEAPVRFFVPHGLMLLCDTKPAVHRHLSRSSNQFYYYDAKAKVSWFPEQPAMATFEETFRRRTLWTWDFEISASGSNGSGRVKVLRHELWNYIQSQLPAK